MPKSTVVTVPADIPQFSGTPDLRPVRRRTFWREIAAWVWRAVMALLKHSNLPINILAFLLSRVYIMDEISPFALAFFAALIRTAKDRAGAAAVWSLAGTLSVGRYAEAAAFLLSVGVFYRFSGKFTRIHEKLYAISLLVFGVSLLSGLAVAIWQEGTLYGLMLLGFNSALCAVLAYIFSYGAPLLLSGVRLRGMANESVICAVVLLSAAVAGIGPVSLWGYSVRNIVGTLLVLVLAYSGGTGLGASAGVAVGLVVGLSDGNAAVAVPLFVMAGLLAGLFRGLGKFASVLSFGLGSAIAVLYFGQADTLLSELTEVGAASLVFVAVPGGRLAAWRAGLLETESSAATGSQAVSEAAGKLSRMAVIFNDLAGAFNQMAAGTTEKIREEELARILSTVGERVCESCVRRSVCWERDFYQTYQAVLDSVILLESGSISSSTLPFRLRDNCIKRTEMADALNIAAEKNRAYSHWQKKLAGNRQMLTDQMRAISGIIDNLALELVKQPASDYRAASVIKEKAALLECELSDVKVAEKNGGRLVEITKNPCPGNRECLNTLLPLVSGIIQEKLALHAVCGNSHRSSKCKLAMQSSKRYALQFGTAAAAKDRQGISGDKCSILTLSRGRVALMLSDGMGTGSRAAQDSAQTLQYLEKLLIAGFDADVAARTVNSILVLKSSDETFATLDMTVIDTCTGQAEFLKVGAAPSFIKRVREVMTVNSASLPAGILPQIEIEPVRFDLTPGDMVIMVSDGIIDASRRMGRENWVVNFLRRQSADDPREIANALLNQAQELSGSIPKDDMSVLAAKVVVETEAIGQESR